MWTAFFEEGLGELCYALREARRRHFADGRSLTATWQIADTHEYYWNRHNLTFLAVLKEASLRQVRFCEKRLNPTPDNIDRYFIDHKHLDITNTLAYFLYKGKILPLKRIVSP